MNRRAELRIGQVAREAGVRTSKIRYYESVGLLGTVARVGACRVYGPETLDALRFIQFAQHAGFSIDEIRHLLDGFDRETPASTRWQNVAQQKMRDVSMLVERGQRMQKVLAALLSCECVELSECVQSCDPGARADAL